MRSIRRLIVLLPLIVLALLSFAWLRHGGDNTRANIRVPNLFSPTANATNATVIPHPSDDATLIAFWADLSVALQEAAPKCALPTNPIEAPINSFASVGKDFNYRPDLLVLPPEDVTDLKDAHTKYVAKTQELAPRLPYAKGTRGIVTTAAGEFMPPLIVSLRMLRRTGSKLPVEVFMENSAVYEPEICEAVLPKLNATCKVMTEILDTGPTKVEISRYQLKAFAMLLSSFDEVLLLDADNIALEAPENLMAEEPFVRKGFVSWPDYWGNTASPRFYEISSQPVPPTSTRPSSESGQLLLSKSLQAQTLLLAVYYNFYGPSHYYKLLSQGAIGEGDKETYLAAAMALNTTFHTVQENVDTLGYQFGDSKQFKGCGAVQHNPSDDYQKNDLQNATVRKIRPSFVHAQTYKMNAEKVVDTFQAEINQRMWGSRDIMMEKFGRDVEKQTWADTLYTGCQLEHSFKDWQGKTGICKKIGRVYKFLFD